MRRMVLSLLLATTSCKSSSSSTLGPTVDTYCHARQASLVRVKQLQDPAALAYAADQFQASVLFCLSTRNAGDDILLPLMKDAEATAKSLATATDEAKRAATVQKLDELFGKALALPVQ